jgi:hypothetical protein
VSHTTLTSRLQAVGALPDSLAEKADPKLCRTLSSAPCQCREQAIEH